MERKAVDFLKRLGESFGPSGFEREPLRIVRDYVGAFADGMETDRLGSLLFRKRGGAERPVILMPGHVDRCVELLAEVVRRLDAKTVERFTAL